MIDAETILEAWKRGAAFQGKEYYPPPCNELFAVRWFNESRKEVGYQLYAPGREKISGPYWFETPRSWADIYLPSLEPIIAPQGVE